jgi:hypothetical protein
MTIDWSELGRNQHGLAVEGKNDHTIIEAFLKAGEQNGHWANWRTRILIQAVGSWSKVVKELESPNRVPKYAGKIWGLIDRDWKTDSEVITLKQDHPRLLILPRIMIENYLIVPNELVNLFPTLQHGKASDMKKYIEAELDHWVQNGAMWQTLHEEDADRFCRDKEDEPGYPGALRKQPITKDSEITEILQEFQTKLDPNTILPAYHTKLKSFRSRSKEDRYRRCIYGKNFFNQVVIQALNQIIGQQGAGDWVSKLIESPPNCPTDLADTLKELLS